MDNEYFCYMWKTSRGLVMTCTPEAKCQKTAIHLYQHRLGPPLPWCLGKMNGEDYCPLFCAYEAATGVLYPSCSSPAPTKAIKLEQDRWRTERVFWDDIRSWRTWIFSAWRDVCDLVSLKQILPRVLRSSALMHLKASMPQQYRLDDTASVKDKKNSPDFGNPCFSNFKWPALENKVLTLFFFFFKGVVWVNFIWTETELTKILNQNLIFSSQFTWKVFYYFGLSDK